MEKCGCGRDVRYCVGKDAQGEMIMACNKYKRCLSYGELEALNTSNAKQAAVFKEALQGIVDCGERDSNFPQDGRMYDIAKAALKG